MNTCPNCGNGDVSSKPLLCTVCGKEGCKKCMTYLFTFFQYGHEPQLHENWYCHPSQCYENFAEEMKNWITVDVIDRDKFGIGLLRGVFHNAARNMENKYWFKKKIPYSLSLDDFLFTNANLELVAKIEKHGKKINLQDI